MEKKKISICINTYKRPHFLDRLFDSIVIQKNPDLFNLEVIIVDNDATGSAKEKVSEWTKKEILQIKYFVQPIQNISLTRNKAVQEAKGDYIFFIDDDGYATENWVKNMLDTLEQYNADGVFGTVLPYFDGDTEDWIKNTGLFERLIQKTGEESKYFRTGNCLVKRNILHRIEGPFDPALGLTGGEDSNLFKKLKSLGYKFVFCEEAIVYDFVPIERANMKYLRHRYKRTGITSIEGKIKRSKIPVITRLYFLLRSIFLILLSLLMYLFCFPFKSKRYFWVIKLSSYIGHFLATLNKRIEGYKLSV